MMLVARIGDRLAPGPLNDAHFATLEEAGEAAAGWIVQAREAGVKGLVLFVGGPGERGYRAALLSRAAFNRLIRENPDLYAPQWRARLRELDLSNEAMGFVRAGKNPLAPFRIPLEAKGPDLAWLLAHALSGDGAVS